MFNVSYPKKPLPPNQKSSKENPQTSQQRSSPVQPYEGDETMLNVMFRKQGPESLVPAMENEDETKAEKPLITQAMLKRYLRVKKEMRRTRALGQTNQEGLGRRGHCRTGTLHRRGTPSSDPRPNSQGGSRCSRSNPGRGSRAPGDHGRHRGQIFSNQGVRGVLSLRWMTSA